MPHEPGPTLRETPVEVVMPAHGVFVLESHHASTFRAEVSAHEFLEVFHVIGGAGRFRIEGRVHPCRSGDLIAVPPGQLHTLEDEPETPLSLYGICVARTVWRHEPELPAFFPAGRLHVEPRLVPQVRSHLRRLLFEQTLARTLSRTAILGMTLELLASLARSSAGRAPHAEAADPGPAGHREAVRRYVEALRREFFEPGDIDRAAHRLGLSRRRFTQLFRETARTSWREFVAGLRIDHACRLLRETNRSVMAITFECGYDDVSTFSRAFKRKTGLPPSEWRRRSTSERGFEVRTEPSGPD